MDDELQKLVTAGKLNSSAAQQLMRLQPGAYCLHRSWGFGRVAAWNPLLNQITVDFKQRKGHTMQLDYAAGSLQPLAEEHILVRIANDAEGVKALLAADPLAAMRVILESHGGRANADQIAAVLVGTVQDEKTFKNWWESAKKLLKKDGHFEVGNKRTDPVILRAEAVSRADELLAALRAARQIKARIAAYDAISRELGAFADPAALQAVLANLEEDAAKAIKLHAPQALELALVRDEIASRTPSLQARPEVIGVGRILADNAPRLAEVLEGVSVGRLRQVLALLPRTWGAGWQERALRLLGEAGSRLAPELGKLLREQGAREQLLEWIKRAIHDRSAPSEVLAWVCRERDNSHFEILLGPDLLHAILASLERDQLTERRGGRLRELLDIDRELIPDLLLTARTEEVRDLMRKFMMSPLFDDLSRRSLLARVVKTHPEMESMLVDDRETKSDALVVSWASLEARRKELEELVTKKIPENIRDIQVARSYGDLRENFEFKSAKEMQAVLLRRRAEIERDLSRARGTAFENPDASQVSIGTVVTVREPATGHTDTFTLLGAWDSDPAQHILSYLTATGQALLGKRPGDKVDLPTEEGTRLVEVTEIRACAPIPPLETPVAPTPPTQP